MLNSRKIENNFTLFSNNKERFKSLSQPEQVSYQLKVTDLPILIAHYKEKYGITIYKSGDTGFKEKHIKSLQEKYNLQNISSLPYAAFIQDWWRGLNQGNYEDFIIDFYHATKHLIKPYLDENGLLRLHLSTRELKEIDEACRRDNKIAEVMNETIEIYLMRIARGKPGKYTHAEICEEVHYLQAQLSKDQCVGYIHTGMSRKGEKHLEVLIITPTTLIKPVIWRTQYFSKNDFKRANYSEAYLAPFIESNQRKHKIPSRPQAGEVECGTLGLLYLRELLKDKAALLKNASFSVPYYPVNENKAEYLFIPASQILRYSQVSSFNKFMIAMMSDAISEVVHYVSKQEQYTAKIKPAYMVLEETKQKAQVLGDEKVMNECNEVFNKLTAMREQWLKVYHQEVMSKRDQFKNASGQRLYLQYHTKKNEERVEEMKKARL